MGSVFLKHETAEGEHQAIRIKRYAESMFLPGRKLAGVNANKSKVRLCECPTGKSKT